MITEAASVVAAIPEVRIHEESTPIRDYILNRLSSFYQILLMASFAIPLYTTGAWQPPDHAATAIHQVAYYVTLFSFYVANYFIVVFFNAAIVACAALRLTGFVAALIFCWRAGFAA